MKVLVTGGTGFLGKRLAYRLQELGYDVTILGRNLLIGEQLKQQGFNFVAVDLQDYTNTINACKGQDYIFHCAALSSPWGKYQDFYQANVIGTRHIIQGSKIHQIKRLIHVSTSAIYFDFQHRLNIKENDILPSKSVNAYAATKLLAEKEILQAYQNELATIIIRPRGIFGVGDTVIFPRLLRANQRLGIPLINQGNAYLDITYIDNVVQALILCLSAPDNVLGRAFNISDGQPIILIDLLKMLFQKLDYQLRLKPLAYPIAYWLTMTLEQISRLTQKEPLLTRYSVGLLSFSQTLDITAAKQQLNYHPQVTLEEGLENFANWWKINNH